MIESMRVIVPSTSSVGISGLNSIAANLAAGYGKPITVEFMSQMTLPSGTAPSEISAGTVTSRAATANSDNAVIQTAGYSYSTILDYERWSEIETNNEYADWHQLMTTLVIPTCDSSNVPLRGLYRFPDAKPNGTWRTGFDSFAPLFDEYFCSLYLSQTSYDRDATNLPWPARPLNYVIRGVNTDTLLPLTSVGADVIARTARARLNFNLVGWIDPNSYAYDALHLGRLLQYLDMRLSPALRTFRQNQVGL